MPSSWERNKAFNDGWSSTLPPDFSPVIVITGAASGLGNVMTRRMSEMLRGRRAKFFLVGRNEESGLRTIADLRRADESYSSSSSTGEEEAWIDPERYTFLTCDLTYMSNVHSLSESIKSKTDKVNYLVHCAGTYNNTGYGADPTREAIESPELANRYYARFRLTFELLELLRRGGEEGDLDLDSREGGGGGRGEGRGAGGERTTAGVMTVLGTGIPFWNRIDLDDLGFHKYYGFALRVMIHSGVYNDLFITELARREPSSNISFTHFSPATTRTAWWSNPGPSSLIGRVLLFLLTPLVFLISFSAQDTAEAMIYSLLSGKGGRWYRRTVRGDEMERERAFPMLGVEGAGERLWEHSLVEARCTAES